MFIPRDVSQVKQKLSYLPLVLKTPIIFTFIYNKYIKAFCQQFVFLFMDWYGN